MYSPADGCKEGADFQAHNSLNFAVYLMQQLNNYKNQHGIQVLFLSLVKIFFKILMCCDIVD